MPILLFFIALLFLFAPNRATPEKITASCAKDHPADQKAIDNCIKITNDQITRDLNKMAFFKQY